MTSRILLSATLAFAFALMTAGAQQRESALSDREVEKLRDTAYYPSERVLAFIEFLDQRTAQMEKLSSGKRRPGREEDLHELMEQFTSVADDLDDNLDDYSTRHKDIRKALPKLLAATERWGTALKTPADDDAYSVSRKLALEAVNDIRESAKKLVEEQKAYFLAHPPAKEEQVPRRDESQPRRPF